MKLLSKIFLLLVFNLTFIQISYSEEFKFTKNHTIEIFDQNEMVENTYGGDIYGLVNIKVNNFIKKDDKKIHSIISTLRLDVTGELGKVKQFLQSYLFNNNDSVFRENVDNNIYLNNKKTNVLIIKNFKLNKWLTTSDDFPELKSPLKKLFFDNGFDTPENILRSDHLYFKGNGSVYWVSYMYNYEKDLIENSYKSSLSKFHPNNINSEKKYKLYMDEWIKLSLKRHQKFQEDFKIKRNLDLDSLNYNFSDELEVLKNNFYEASLDENKEKERKAKLEAEKKAKAEKERKAKLEAEKKAKAEKERKAKLEAEKNKLEQNQGSSEQVDDLITRIKELNDMYEKGIISEDEFKILKDKLISN